MPKSLFKFLDWVITLVILSIGIYFLVFTLVPHEYIAKITGWGVTVAVQHEPVRIGVIAAYVIPLASLYYWGFIKKKHSVTFWLKIAGVTMVVFSMLLLYLVIVPITYNRFTA